MTINEFIKQRKSLMWYAGDYDKLSETAIAEAVLNYGGFNDVKKMINILSIKKTAAIFRKLAKQKRSNLRPEIKHYFNLFFKKYA